MIGRVLGVTGRSFVIGLAAVFHWCWLTTGVFVVLWTIYAAIGVAVAFACFGLWGEIPIECRRLMVKPLAVLQVAGVVSAVPVIGGAFPEKREVECGSSN